MNIHAENGSPISAAVDAAKADLDSLLEKKVRIEEQIRIKEEVIAYLLRSAPRAASPRPERSKATSGEEAKHVRYVMGGAELAPDLDAILTEEPGKRFTVRDLLAALRRRGVRLHPQMKAPADITARGSLESYREKYGWQREKVGKKVVFWKQSPKRE